MKFCRRSIGCCVFDRRDGLPGVVEEGFEGGVHVLIEEDHVAAVMEEKPLAIRQIVMDHIDVQGAAGGIQLAITQEGGLAGVERLFRLGTDRRHLPAITERAIDIVDVIAAHIGVKVVVELMQNALVVVGGLVRAVDGEPHTGWAVGAFKDDPRGYCDAS